MRAFICVLLLVAWPSLALDWTPIEQALLDEQKAWMLASDSSTALTGYFKDEAVRLTAEKTAFEGEKRDFQDERTRFAEEKSAHETLRRQLSLDRQQIGEDSKRLDERVAALERAEWIRRATPWVAAGVFAAGMLTGALLTRSR